MKPTKDTDAGGTYHYRIEWVRRQPKSLWKRFRNFAMEPREPSPLTLPPPPRPRIPTPQPTGPICLACDEEFETASNDRRDKHFFAGNGRTLLGVCDRCRATIRSFRFLSDTSFNDALPQCSGFPDFNGCRFKHGHSGPCEEGCGCRENVVCQKHVLAGAPHA